MNEDRVKDLLALIEKDEKGKDNKVLAWIEKEWGITDGPVGGPAFPMTQRAKGKLCRSASESVVVFPVRMKTGPKVRKGPCADVLPFPGSLSPADLLAQWSWLRKNYSDWNNEETSGRDEEKAWRRTFFTVVGVSEARDKPLPDRAGVRRDVAKFQAVIKKRILVKDWLESLGINWDDVDSPEEALFFAFDRLSARSAPAIA